MRPEQNTTLNAKKEQFITAYISSNALKQVSIAHSNKKTIVVSP